MAPNPTSLVHEYTRSAKNNTYSIPFSAENGIRGNTYVFHSCLRDEIGKAADPAALIRKLGADGTDSEEEALFKKVADRVAKTELELATYQQREGTFTKANVVSKPRRWRRQNGGQPIASTSRSVLGQPVCASAAERNWSVYGQIKTIGLDVVK